MKQISIIVVMLMMFPAMSFARNHEKSYRGQIMDSMCAHSGGHAPGGYQATHTDTPKDCTLACNKAGSPLVLFNKKKNTIYNLDDQDKAKTLAGEDVKVEGTLDRSTKTIHVQSIEPAS